MLKTTNLVICCIPAPHRRVVTARALGANGIDLIDEDDARGVFSSLTGSCLDRRYTPED